MEPRMSNDGRERLISLFGTATPMKDNYKKMLAELSDECLIEKPIKTEIGNYFQTYERACEFLTKGRMFKRTITRPSGDIVVFEMGLGVFDRSDWFTVLTDLFAECKISPKAFSEGGVPESNMFYPAFQTQEALATYWYENFYSLPRIKKRFGVPEIVQKYAHVEPKKKKAKAQSLIMKVGTVTGPIRAA